MITQCVKCKRDTENLNSKIFRHDSHKLKIDQKLGGWSQKTTGGWGTKWLHTMSTIEVMHNPFLKFRQSSIISKKAGYLSAKLKIWPCSNYHIV